MSLMEGAGSLNEEGQCVRTTRSSTSRKETSIRIVMTVYEEYTNVLRGMYIVRFNGVKCFQTRDFESSPKGEGSG